MPALGYLIPEFPGQTHIWMWREIRVLREAGVNVKIISTTRPPASACQHDFAAAGRSETHYLYPPSIAAGLIVPLTRPAGAWRAARYVGGLSQSSLGKKFRTLAMSPCAADLVRFASRNDIAHVHAHSCADAAHICAMAHAISGLTYSLTLHGDLPVYGTDHASKMRQATCITTDGPHLVKQIVEQVGIDESKLMSNWMGVNTDVFIDAGRRKPEPRRLRLITVARLHRCKGHVHALRAMRTLIDEGIDIRYVLAGAGPHREEIIDEIRDLKLTDRVELLGTRGEADVLEELQRADVFVLPSVGIGEAGPISVMEAMSTGLPVVASVIGATPQMIDDGRSGLLTPQADESSIAAALRKLANDLPLRAAVGAAARQHAVANFDSGRTAIRLLDLIERTSGQRFRK